MRGLEDARARQVAWDDARETSVLSNIRREQSKRLVRSRAISLALSSLVGMALIVLAARAFGGNTVTHDYSPTYAYGDGGREN
jgi:hypothetical protein